MRGAPLTAPLVTHQPLRLRLGVRVYCLSILALPASQRRGGSESRRGSLAFRSGCVTSRASDELEGSRLPLRALERFPRSLRSAISGSARPQKLIASASSAARNRKSHHMCRAHGAAAAPSDISRSSRRGSHIAASGAERREIPLAWSVHSPE